MDYFFFMACCFPVPGFSKLSFPGNSNNVLLTSGTTSNFQDNF